MSLNLLAAAAVGALAAPPFQCAELSGAHLVINDASKPFIIVGERHGTAEIPMFFANLVCLAASKGPVVVGLEFEPDQQSSLDTYLASDGAIAARSALLTERHWGYPDGRASEAMFRLLDQLRQLKLSGQAITVLAFMRNTADPDRREQAMATAWQESLEAKPGAKLLALVGAVHAERERLGNFVPAAHWLPRDRTITLNYVASGPRGVVSVVSPKFRWPRYDLWYSVGQPFSRSPLERKMSR
ncbi:MAG: hypothetical protein M3Q88_04600 [Pseudomonadota bacterium]|nr:hypothetical protein [Pseudomonadota bacterium]